MPNTQALLQRGGVGSSSGWTDPFSSQKSDPTACFDWANNFGPVGYNQPADSGKRSYNPASNRKATSVSKVSRSDTSMPDYGLGSANNNTQGMSDHQFLNLAASSLTDADTSTHDLKAPTNTPTTMVGSNFMDDLGIDVNKIGTPGSMSAHYRNDLTASQQSCKNVDAVGRTNTYSTADMTMNDYFSSNHPNFSSELATSLTHSLLNQPHPLPVQASTIPPPAPEVKSRKETRLNQDSPSEHASTIDHAEMRKVSQASFNNVPGKENLIASANNSPPSQSAFSGVFSHRSTSAGDFGNDLTNITNVFTHPTMDSPAGCDASTDLRNLIGPEKSLKRTRHFTPGGGKAMEDDAKVLANSPMVQEVLDDHFGEH